ncbi:MAG: hypothetical protein WAZ77_12970 [Candidatus Nitrosopolaris sp.]|jgi:hypothetical protein
MTTKKRNITSRDELVRYILKVAQKSDIDLSLANELETKRILRKVPSLSEQIIKNRHN